MINLVTKIPWKAIGKGLVGACGIVSTVDGMYKGFKQVQDSELQKKSVENLQKTVADLQKTVEELQKKI